MTSSGADKAVVLTSGGLDSAVCLWHAKTKGWRLYALSCNYHQRHTKEMEAARRLAEAAGVEEFIQVDLPFLREVKDGVLSPDNPLSSQDRAPPPAYVPARNTVFYAVAAFWGESLGARWIVGGHNLEDQVLFPDASPTYFRLYNELLKGGTYIGRIQPMEIITPLSGLAKADVVGLAFQLSVPIHLTWSCYERGEKHCGLCPACSARMRAFRLVGHIDPVEYE